MYIFHFKISLLQVNRLEEEHLHVTKNFVSCVGVVDLLV